MKGIRLLPRRLVILALEVWHFGLAPLFGAACRFEPSCSMYAAEAVGRHGVARGLGLAVRRVARCHPFHSPGYDPVP